MAGDNGKKIHFRRSHKKSHLGCQTCKQRRIKCDEQLPCCGQCVRYKSVCSFVHLTADEIKIRRRINGSSSGRGSGRSSINSDGPSMLSISNGSFASQSIESNPAENFHLGQGLGRSMPVQHVQPGQTAQSSHHHQSYGNDFENIDYVANRTTNILSPFNSLSSPYNTPPPPPTNDPIMGSVCLPPISSTPHVPTTLPPLINQGFTLPPLTKEQANIVNLQARTDQNTISLVQLGFETDFMRNAYHNWMSNTLALSYEHSCLYHAITAFSYGFLAIKTGRQDLRNDADKHRFIALHEIQQELANVNEKNTDALLDTSLILSWDVFFQEESVEAYITLSKGLAAVLERVQVTAAATQTALCMTESLFQSIKSIQLPPYDSTFVGELVEKIRALEPYIVSSGDSTLVQEHVALVSFVEKIQQYLHTTSRMPNSLCFPPHDLYTFLREWLATFPCLALSLDTLTSQHCIVLYTYYHAVTRTLDALFPEVRYLYQFGFIGPIDLVGVEHCVSYVTSPEALVLLKYPLKIVTFFKERLFLLNRLLISKDPFGNTTASGSTSASTTSSWGPKQQRNSGIKEVFVTSFDNTNISTENYPYCDTSTVRSMSSSSSSLTTNEDFGSPVSSGASSSGFTSTSSFTSSPMPSTSNPLASSDEEPITSPSPMETFRTYFMDRMEILQTVSVGS